jgi:hypothetical protein
MEWNGMEEEWSNYQWRNRSYTYGRTARERRPEMSLTPVRNDVFNEALANALWAMRCECPAQYPVECKCLGNGWNPQMIRRKLDADTRPPEVRFRAAALAAQPDSTTLVPAGLPTAPTSLGTATSPTESAPVHPPLTCEKCAQRRCGCVGQPPPAAAVDLARSKPEFAAQQRKAFTRTCPTCNATPGTECVSADGVPLYLIPAHKERTRA